MLRVLAEGNQRGAALVTVVLWLPVLILIPIFVIDFGNWLEHKRHLQTQADAAALAAAGDYRFPCDDTAIQNRARQYGGVETGGYNQQIGGTSPSDVHFLLNSRDYYNQPGKIDDTVDTDPPCQAGMIDVKLTETDLPLFFRAASLFTSVPFINAHARVQVFEKQSYKSTLPIGVPSPNPAKVTATFIDEGSGAVLGTRDLTRTGTSNGQTLWDNSASPLPVTVGTNSNRIGVRIALSGDPSTSSCSSSLVTCYDQALFVRGYSNAGSGAAPNQPIARSVYVTSNTCSSNPDYFVSSGTCTIGVHADVDFGTCNLGSSGSGIAAGVTASPGGALTLGPCSNGVSQWTGSFTVGAGAGTVPVTLSWREQKAPQKITGASCKNNKAPFDCNGSLENAQTVARTYGAQSSAQIQSAQFLGGGHSVERCSSVQSSCTYPYVVQIGLTQAFEQNAQSVDTPPFHIAIVGNQNGHLDCNPLTNTNLRYELSTGCPDEYIVNDGTGCAFDPDPQPWDCVPLQTGNSTGQVRQGMNDRIQGGSNQCVNPNHWSDFPNLDPGDPRISYVFLTPYNTFQGTGNDLLPITGFAVFYISGYDGDPCPGDDPAGRDEVVGRFIKYVQTLNDGTGGNQTCDVNQLGACVAVLTQ